MQDRDLTPAETLVLCQALDAVAEKARSESRETAASLARLYEGEKTGTLIDALENMVLADRERARIASNLATLFRRNQASVRGIIVFYG